MRAMALSFSLVLIFVIPWEGVIQLPGLGTVARSLGLAVGAFWLATVVISGRFRKPGAFHIAVAIFVLWNAISVFWSADVNRSMTRVGTWVQLLVLVLIIWDLYTTRAALLAGLQAYVLGAYIAVVGAIVNYIAGNPVYSNFQRFSSGETNPDGFAFIVVLGVPVAWYLAGSMSVNRRGYPLLKFLNYAYILVALFGIALSGTRTAMIAAIPATAYGLASLGGVRIGTRIAVVVLLSSAVLIILPEIQPLRSFQRLGTTATELVQGDLNQRLGIWSEGLATFAERPLTGVGSNMYRSVNSLGKVGHNSFISVLVELGLIGFALFAIPVTIAVFQAWGQPKWERNFWLTVFVIWVIGSSALTWEHRKTTWLFLSFMVASAALVSHPDEAKRILLPDKPMQRLLRPAALKQSPAGREEILSVD